MIKDEDIRNKLKEIDEHIKKEYVEGHPEIKNELLIEGHVNLVCERR